MSNAGVKKALPRRTTSNREEQRSHSHKNSASNSSSRDKRGVKKALTKRTTSDGNELRSHSNENACAHATQEWQPSFNRESASEEYAKSAPVTKEETMEGGDNGDGKSRKPNAAFFVKSCERGFQETLIQGSCVTRSLVPWSLYRNEADRNMRAA